MNARDNAPLTDYLANKSQQQRWRDVCEVTRAIIDHPMLLNDPVLVVATCREDFKARLERESQSEQIIVRGRAK